ncbi:MAG: prealbumin-like fold domain-containing protein [Gaiellaceae bacterium]
MTTVTLVVVAVSGAAPGTDASVTTFDQCANGAPPSTATDCPENWINGILNAQNSHYAEDEVTPQRVLLELPEDSPATGRTVEISYLTRKGGVHAYDSLATWNHTQTSADRCANLPAADCMPGPESTSAILSDSTVVADLNGAGSATSGHQLSGQVFTMYGGTITSVSPYSHDDPSGTSDSYAHVTLTYSVPTTADDDVKVMLLFGAHIAASVGPRGWGANVGAGSISGGPYHVRITAADGASVGNRDNQIMSSAILSPAHLVVRKVAVGGDATFDYTATGGISSAFSIPTSGGTGQTTFADLTPGTYTVTESALPSGWDFTNLVCEDDDGGSSVDLGLRKATIDLDPGQTVTCTYTNTKRGTILVEKQTQPDGDPQLFSFTPSYGSSFQLSDGQQNDSGLLAAGTYSVAETVPSGWSLLSVTCDDGSNPSSIGLSAGETVKCTFTNAKLGSIVVDKVTVPANDPQSFSFSLTGGPDSVSQSFGLTHVATPHDSGPVKPGSYSVAETVPAGWSLTSAVCSDGSAATAIALDAGETVTCTFTNTKQSKIVVEKQTNPEGDPQSFGFTASYDGDGFSLTDGQQNDSGPLAAGTYAVSENVPAGWDLESAVCSDASPANAIALAAGETVTCVFTNEKDAKIVVEKQTSPDGSQQVFPFTASYDGDGFSLADGQQSDSGDLDPGTYSVSETVPAGWDLTSAVCSDGSGVDAIGLAAGETVTCVFTNTQQPGAIVVEKQTNPDGDPQLFAFTASYDLDGFQLSDGQQSSSGTLPPGTYSVSENVPAGWDLESAVCSDQSPVNAIALAAGETVTCVFTNEKDAKIVVEKQTLPNGDPQSFSFDASYDGDGFSLTDGQQSGSGDLDPGTYSVSENVPAGWDLESAVCSDGSPVNAIALAAGETVTCVFTNEKDAKIVVEKQTLPDGDLKSFHFDASYDEGGFSLTDGQQSDSGDLEPGTYSVSEDVPAGWDLESAVCSDQSDPGQIALAAGETVTCVFTNEKDAKIVVEKQTLPNADPQSFAFAASYDGDGFSLTDGQQSDSGDLDPGTYSVSENVPAGWNLTSAECSDESDPEAIGLAAGETVTCVFTNTRLGSIVVEKQTSPDGAAGSFSFSGDAAGAIADNGQIVVANLVPGTYTSTEAAAEGFILTGISCNDANSTGSLEARTATFRVEAGETVKCTFTNTKLQTGRGSISVSKSASPTQLEEPGGQVTYSVTIQNTSNVMVSITQVVDDKFGNLENVAGGNPSGCFDVPINIEPGDSVNCMFPKSITGAGGTSHVNVVTASGSDEFGNPVTGSDDARVDLTPRLIDLQIVKEATSPTPLNGIVNYTMTVTNKGPNAATNVQLADPAPSGITYLTASPSQGTCNLTPSLVTCSLGSIAAGESVTVRVTARATTVGMHTNVATVTGSGGRETNPADNVDDALTVVPAPARPPVAKPAPAPVCLALSVSPKMIKADGKPDRVRVKVTAGKKRVKGTKVRIFGAGVRKAARSNKKGLAVLRINPRRPGLITITVVERNRRVCGPKRIGVVGVFLPPLTG